MQVTGIIASQVLSRGYSDVYEKEYVRKGGATFPVELRVFLLGNETGAHARMWAIVRDITERKRIEELHTRAEKLEALGTLAGGVAHDFNNILLAINGNALLAASEVPPEHPVQRSLTEILKAGHRARDLVRRILTFSRPQDQRREVLPLGPIVEEALKLVRAAVPAMIEIRAKLGGELPAVFVDSSQAHQVIVNLATNAAYAIGDGPGVIEVRLDATTVTDDEARVTDLPDGRYVRVSVSDDGCGMDCATLDRAFDPFFTTKPASAGTGLGLSVVHGIMRGHEGAVSATSEVGTGSLFRLYFPVAETAASAPSTRDSQAVRGHGERILFVDDEEALVFLVPRLLEKLGYRVTAFGSAELALDAFRSRPGDFELVVTDLSMPRMSGLDLAREMLATRPDLPIVLTSGYVRPELEETARRMGIRAVVLKPDTVDEMGSLLSELLQGNSVPP